jgi:hypothetical protein
MLMCIATICLLFIPHLLGGLRMPIILLHLYSGYFVHIVWKVYRFNSKLETTDAYNSGVIAYLVSWAPYFPDR